MTQAALLASTALTQPHTGRAHSKLGPSAASRWMACAGSVGMSEGQANTSTVFALEGTAAHEFNEFIISNGHEPQEWLGGCVDLEADDKSMQFMRDGHNHEIDRERFFEIDAEMIEGCELTQATIDEYYRPEEGDVLMLETRLDMSWIHPKLFGTGDILIYKAKSRTLVVIDYKYGSGHVVEVKDNPQVWTYAIGGVKLFEAQGVDTVELVIVQPRAFHHDGPVRRQTIDVIDLFVFEGILAQAAHATDDPDAPLVAGEHCKFCPAAHGCEMLRLYAFCEVLGLKLTSDKELTEKDMPRMQDLTPARLGRIVREAKIVEGFLRRAVQMAHAEALEGRIPEGCKLVDKRAYRKFTAPEGEIVARLDMEGFSEDDYMKEPKLLTLAQLEKVLGKKVFVEMFGKDTDPNKLWKKESSGYVLADIDDKRPAVKLDHSDAFGAVEDDE